MILRLNLLRRMGSQGESRKPSAVLVWFPGTLVLGAIGVWALRLLIPIIDAKFPSQVQRSIQDLQVQESRLNKDLLPLASVDAQLNSARANNTATSLKLEEFKAFLPEEKRLSVALKSVMEALPAEVWLTELSWDYPKLKLMGSGLGSEVVTAFLQRLQAQSNLAEVMVDSPLNVSVPADQLVTFSLNLRVISPVVKSLQVDNPSEGAVQ